MAAPTMTPSRWVGGGLALFVAGSVVLLVANGWVLAAALPDPTAWSLILGWWFAGASLAAAV